jgi:hypothetical protein
MNAREAFLLSIQHPIGSITDMVDRMGHGSKWYWLRPDHSIELGPEIEDKDGFAKYTEWLYGVDKDGNPNRHVARFESPDVLVSTVFLGLDHNHSNDGPPIVFETLVFGGPNDQYMYRYATWDEAIAGHKRVCGDLTSGLSREQLEAAKALIEPLLKGS